MHERDNSSKNYEFLKKGLAFYFTMCYPITIVVHEGRTIISGESLTH